MRSSVNDDYDDDNCDQREYTHTHILLGAPLFRLSMTSILLFSGFSHSPTTTTRPRDDVHGGKRAPAVYYCVTRP